jgi:hypothetical protein
LALADALAANATVTGINLDVNDIGAEAAAMLADALKFSISKRLS